MTYLKYFDFMARVFVDKHESAVHDMHREFRFIHVKYIYSLLLNLKKITKYCAYLFVYIKYICIYCLIWKSVFIYLCKDFTLGIYCFKYIYLLYLSIE